MTIVSSISVRTPRRWKQPSNVITSLDLLGIRANCIVKDLTRSVANTHSLTGRQDRPLWPHWSNPINPRGRSVITPLSVLSREVPVTLIPREIVVTYLPWHNQNGVFPWLSRAEAAYSLLHPNLSAVLLVERDRPFSFLSSSSGEKSTKMFSHAWRHI